jgi:SAM-dependent methyltransferase
MTSASEEAQARWDERYGTEGFVFGIEPNQFVATHLAGNPAGRALDLGSGQGRNAVWLALQGHTVTAVDLSPVATQQAQQLAAEASVDVEFIAADLAEWQPEPSSYDLVLLSYLQLPGELRRQVHHKVVTALAPGGTVFLIAHHLDNIEHGIGGPPYPEVNFTEDQLAEDFVELDIETLTKVERNVQKGDVEGTAIDIMLIAKR